MNRWLSPWAAALRIARRQALRAKGRTALSAVMVGLPLMLIATLAVLLTSMTPTEATRVARELGDSAEAMIRPGVCAPLAHPPNVLNEQHCGAPATEHNEAIDAGPGPFGLDAAEAELLVREVLAEAELALVLTGEVTLETPDHKPRVTAVRLLDTTGAARDTVPLLEGRLPTTSSEIALPPGSMRGLGLTLGDTLELSTGTDAATGRTTTAVVTGIVASHLGSAVLTLDAPAPDSSEPWWLVTGPTPVTWADVTSLNEAGFQVVSRDVLHNPPAAQDVPYEVINGAYASDDNIVIAQVGLLVALAVLEVVLLVGPAFAVGARRQSRSLALVAATGGTPRDLRRIVLANGVVIGLGASMLAVGLGVLVAVAVVLWPFRYEPDAIFPNLAVPPWVALLAVAGTAIAVLAAWIPARQAARVDVVAALAGRRSEARPRAALGIVGIVAAAAGVPLALYGGHIGSSTLAGAGGVVIVLGLVAAAGLLISAVGRLARRTGIATRIALRDLSRQRGRTAPAVAAILGAIAAATAGSVFMASDSAHYRAAWSPEIGEGLVKVRLNDFGATTVATEELAAAATEAILAIDPEADVATISIAVPAELPGEHEGWSLRALEDESKFCPWHLLLEPTEEEIAAHADDPRCAQRPSFTMFSEALLHPWIGGVDTVLVDDGTALALFDRDGSDVAAAALAAGSTVVANATQLWSDGTVRFEVWADAHEGNEPSIVGAVPGTLVTTDSMSPPFYSTIVPPSVVDQLEGVDLRIVPHGIVAVPSAPWTQEQEAALDSATRALGHGVTGRVESPPADDSNLPVLVIVGAAGLLALGATWVASGLAAVESRADLATLSAVGAAPRVRRRVAGLQSGFMALVGIVPGLAGGLAVGWAFVAASAGLGTDHPDPLWRLVVPWGQLAVLLVALPLLAGGATALFTPARLPLVRRTLE